MTTDDLTLDTTQSIHVKADIGHVFRSVLYRLGEGFTEPPEGESMQMTLEQWPGGRWFRDRGNGIGHLWGHLQVIKPPVLLELRAHVHVLPGAKPPRSETRIAARRNACGPPSPSHRLD